MNEQPLKPGQFRVKRRSTTRQQFAPLKNLQINTVDDAIAFVEILNEKMPQLRKALSKVKLQGVYSNSRQAAEKITTNPIAEQTVTGTDNALSNLGEAAKIQGATSEQRRLQQLRDAREAIQNQPAERKPVQMPGIPGVSEGPREMPKPPEEAGAFISPSALNEKQGKAAEILVSEDTENITTAPEETHSMPAGIPMDPDEETEMSSDVTAEETEAIKKARTNEKRKAALAKARAVKAAKKSTKKSE